METKLKRTSVLMVAAVGLMLIQCGCGGGAAKTGFLTDYSNLNQVSASSLQYMNEQALARYSNFMVDTVEVHFHKGSKAVEQQTEGKITEQQMTELTNYMHTRIVKAVEDSGNNIAYQPSPGVARIRAAITDIDKSTLVSILPPAKVIAGAGIGGASMEAEIVDSMTGEQIGAVVESRSGTRIPFANLGKWEAAKQVINDWTKRLQKRLQ